MLLVIVFITEWVYSPKHPLSLEEYTPGTLGCVWGGGAVISHTYDRFDLSNLHLHLHILSLLVTSVKD